MGLGACQGRGHLVQNSTPACKQLPVAIGGMTWAGGISRPPSYLNVKGGKAEKGSVTPPTRHAVTEEDVAQLPPGSSPFQAPSGLVLV